MISDGIYTLVSGNAALQALLGLPTTRQDKRTGVFFNQAGEDADTPHIIFSQVSPNPTQTMDGAEAAQSARWQFSVYDVTPEGAKRVARTLRLEIEGFRGNLSDGTEVDGIQYVSEIDLFEPAVSMHHVPIDFEIWYRDVGD